MSMSLFEILSAIGGVLMVIAWATKIAFDVGQIKKELCLTLKQHHKRIETVEGRSAANATDIAHLKTAGG